MEEERDEAQARLQQQQSFLESDQHSHESQRLVATELQSVQAELAQHRKRNSDLKGRLQIAEERANELVRFCLLSKRGRATAARATVSTAGPSDDRTTRPSANAPVFMRLCGAFEFISGTRERGATQ